VQKRRTFISRQMQQCICLVFILAADLYSQNGDVSVEEYLRRQIHRQSAAEELLQGTDTGVTKGTTINVSAGFDQVYHESVSDDDTMAFSGDWKRDNAGIAVTGTTPAWGGTAGFWYHDADVSWSGEKSATNGSVVNEGAAVFCSGWFKRSVFSGAVGLTSDIPPLKALRENAFPVRSFKKLLLSQFLDGFIAVQSRMLWGQMTVAALNGTPITLISHIRNSTKTADRRFACPVNDNAVSLSLSGSRLNYEYECATLYGSLSEGFPVAYSQTLPVFFDGWRSSSSGGIRKLNGMWRPDFSVGYDYLSLALHGHDPDGGTFLRSGTAGHSSFRLKLFLNRMSGSGIGLFTSNIMGTTGKVLVDYYPFTSWMLLFDLPDGIKIDMDSYHLAETGVAGKRALHFGTKHEIIVQGAVSVMKTACNLQTAERDRYLGLVPVYQNEKEYKIRKEYLVFKIAAGYGIQIREHTMSLLLQQILPVPIGDTQKSGVFSSDEGRSSKRSIFGGFTAQCRVTFNR